MDDTIAAASCRYFACSALFPFKTPSFSRFPSFPSFPSFSPLSLQIEERQREQLHFTAPLQQLLASASARWMFAWSEEEAKGVWSKRATAASGRFVDRKNEMHRSTKEIGADTTKDKGRMATAFVACLLKLPLSLFVFDAVCDGELL